MSKLYLLDTNAAIALLNNNLTMAAFLNQVEFYISATVMGELYWGAENSTHAQSNRDRVDAFASQRQLLECDVDTARWYGKVMVQLRRKGRPIPQNDIWIAATALQHNLILLTKDQHFLHVEGLIVESW